MRPVRLVSLLALATMAPAGAADTVQPVAQADAYVAVPGSTFHADNAHVYRVVFDARQGADKPDKLAPAVNLAASELNTLAAHGVKRANLQMAVVFHARASNEAVLDNAHYRAKYGVDNPNLPVLAQLKSQGVELYVCGQSLLADGVALDAVTPEVTLAEDGLIVLMTFGSQGYALLTF